MSIKKQAESKKKVDSTLKEIDREATKAAVEAELYRYKEYMYEVEEEFLPKVTPAYSIAPPAFTNEFHSSVEDAVIDGGERYKKMLEHMAKIQRAVNRLNKKERLLILKKYMDFEHYMDKEIYTDMLKVAERTFYNIQSDALYKLALNLRLRKYVEND